MTQPDLTIAGTSLGGSSYTQRILKMLEAQPDGLRPMTIRVTAGPYQNKVVETLIRSIDTIEAAFERVSGHALVLNINIEKE